MSGGSAGGGGAFDNLETLIKLIADKKDFEGKLKQLREAEAKAKAEADRLSELQHTLVTTRTATEKQSAELASAQSKYDADVAAYQKNRDRTLTTLNQRETELTNREATLNTERAEFDRHERSKLAELERRENELIWREARAADKDAALSQLHAQLTRKSDALQAALAAD
jgi:hypothetical protein